MIEVRNKIRRVIEETMDYYLEDPSRRAFTQDGTCVYFIPETGKKCAVGLWLKEELLKNGGFLDDNLTVEELTVRGELQECLKEEVSDVPPEVFRRLQRWHDEGRGEFWIREGDKVVPTEQGKAHKEFLFRLFNLVP